MTGRSLLRPGVPRRPLQLMYRMYKYVLPDVNDQLKLWRAAADRIPDPELRRQAIASQTSKRFHCQGGAVYAAANVPLRHVLIPLIVALQTISDYLDNLCDRSTSLDPRDFRRLHQAMLDAVDPGASLQDYYFYREEKDDGGYLAALVRTCQSCLCLLPSYSVVEERVRELVGLYCDLQVYKHVDWSVRERELAGWWALHRERYPELRWNEFAAATGSTLGMFQLFLAATDESLTGEQAASIHRAYFPFVCAEHILLDYLIDQQEDRAGGDLNFCFYYETAETTVERLSWIVQEARRSIDRLEHAAFHRMIIEGLMALYLSDPKVRTQPEVRRIAAKLMRKSPWSRLFFWMNSLWIRKRGSEEERAWPSNRSPS